MTQGLYIICVLVVFFGGRICLNSFIETSSAIKKFWLGVGLFASYTFVLLFFLYFIHFEIFVDVESVEMFFQHTLVGILLMNLVVLIIGIVYFLLRSKRKMSDIDKMKLKDL